MGTAYTREPVSGAGDPAGEFRVRDEGGPVDILALQRSMPAAGADLGRALARVEVVHRDMCEVGFVVEEGQLWVDAAEPGGRSSEAAVRIAVDLVDGGLIDVEVALERVPLSALAEMRGSDEPRRRRRRASLGFRRVPRRDLLHGSGVRRPRSGPPAQVVRDLRHNFQIVPPGTDIGTLDQAYLPPALEQPGLRRRPVEERAAA